MEEDDLDESIAKPPVPDSRSSSHASSLAYAPDSTFAGHNNNDTDDFSFIVNNNNSSSDAKIVKILSEYENDVPVDDIKRLLEECNGDEKQVLAILRGGERDTERKKPRKSKSSSSHRHKKKKKRKKKSSKSSHRASEKGDDGTLDKPLDKSFESGEAKSLMATPVSTRRHNDDVRHDEEGKTNC
jgi:DNA-binding transcriptional MerR regulator